LPGVSPQFRAAISVDEVGLPGSRARIACPVEVIAGRPCPV
jgi:hypothetical protein